MAGRNYSRKDSPTTADLPLIWDSANSDWRLATLSSIQTLFDSLETSNKPVTQYLIPTSGFSVTVSDGGTDTQDVHLILTPAGTLATGTIVLPASPANKVEVLVSSTNEVTALTVDGGTATLSGAPTTIAATGYFRMKYDSILSTWFRVG